MSDIWTQKRLYWVAGANPIECPFTHEDTWIDVFEAARQDGVPASVLSSTSQCFLRVPQSPKHLSPLLACDQGSDAAKKFPRLRREIQWTIR